ncbi:MAG: glycosyltransferase [Planctomycetes bacterium]|nr:glycosyltransferase [Planctomycetota bacterium]
MSRSGEKRPRLLFVSPRFLFPADEGGKIRTGQILRGMKGGAFELDLIAPASDAEVRAHRADLEELCDRFEAWPPQRRGALWKLARLRHLLSPLPVAVRTDVCAAFARAIQGGLARRPDLVVFDYVHSAVAFPRDLKLPSVCFTHNVETEIFRRHAKVASRALSRAVWRNQAAKMERFEREALARFTRVVAVSERDAQQFRNDFGLAETRVIPTGVDLDHFRYTPAEANDRVVFCGAMDWAANQDGIGWLLDEVWAKVLAARPSATLTVVGRNVPEGLQAKARVLGASVRFTGWVEDIRPHLQGAAAYAIPLRVGGGTRIKGYEAIAIGSPVVSTAIGVEGLGLSAGKHYLEANDPASFAASLVALLGDAARGRALAQEARAFVEERFSFRHAARAFEGICLEALTAGVLRPERVCSLAR